MGRQDDKKRQEPTPRKRLTQQSSRPTDKRTTDKRPVATPHPPPPKQRVASRQPAKPARRREPPPPPTKRVVPAKSVPARRAATTPQPTEPRSFSEAESQAMSERTTKQRRGDMSSRRPTAKRAPPARARRAETLVVPPLPPLAPIEPNAAIQEWVGATLAAGVTEVRRQFQDVVNYQSASGVTHFANACNLDKNRYKDVRCLDDSRVVLADGDSYIHANYVHTAERTPPARFICTQGPKELTVNDFWRMVWQERSPAIVMLCDFIEQRKEKCVVYYPTKGELFSGRQTVTTTGNGVIALGGSSVHVTRLEVASVLAPGERHTLMHYRWTAWPDRDVPESSEGALQLVRTALMPTTAGARPPIVHCSAGVGRTGALVAVALCLQRLLAGQPTDMRRLVETLRDERARAIQTEMQYLFVHRCVLDYLHQGGQVPAGDAFNRFCADYDALVKH